MPDGRKLGYYLIQSPVWNGTIAAIILAISLSRQQWMQQASVILH